MLQSHEIHVCHKQITAKGISIKAYCCNGCICTEKAFLFAFPPCIITVIMKILDLPY